MGLYKTESGKDVEIKTPLLANILPIGGFALGFLLVFNKDKKNYANALLTGLGVGSLLGIPKLILEMKGLNDIKKSGEKIVIPTDKKEESKEPETVNVDAEVVEENKEIKASLNDLMDEIQKIYTTANKIKIYLPKKSFIEKQINKWSVEELNIAYQYLIFVNSISKPLTDSGIESLVRFKNELEVKYGEALVKNVSQNLNKLIGDSIELLSMQKVVK